MTITLPTTGPDKKTVLFFSGGKSSVYLANKLKEQNGSLDDVIALFTPLSTITKLVNNISESRQKAIEISLEERRNKFLQAVNKLDFGQIIELNSYSDYVFENGDNAIGDRHRRDFYSSMINLLIEKGYDLNSVATIVIGFSADTIHKYDIYDLDSLRNNEKVYMPFIDMAKAEVDAIVS